LWQNIPAKAPECSATRGPGKLRKSLFIEKEFLMGIVKSLGRILLSSMFIYGGAGAFSNPGKRVELVEQAGIPNARRATILNGAIMVISGIALAADIFPKLAATVLIGSLIPTTFVGHSFWRHDDPGSRAVNQIQFFKNASMLGGLLLVLAERED
jgi:putative oxidoreductase